MSRSPGVPGLRTVYPRAPARPPSRPHGRKRYRSIARDVTVASGARTCISISRPAPPRYRPAPLESARSRYRRMRTGMSASMASTGMLRRNPMAKSMPSMPSFIGRPPDPPQSGWITLTLLCPVSKSGTRSGYDAGTGLRERAHDDIHKANLRCRPVADRDARLRIQYGAAGHLDRNGARQPGVVGDAAADRPQEPHEREDELPVPAA